MAVTYSIKPDLFWGDGEPVTAEDFRFSWEMGRHPDSGAAGAEGFRRILDFEVHDERSFGVGPAWFRCWTFRRLEAPR